MENNMEDEVLIEAKSVCLHVPTFHFSELQVRRNPLKILADLYISKGARDVDTLLDNVNFKLYPGQRLGIIGENGAGKSTLLRVLAGIYQPSSGKLEINGTTKGLFDISLGMHPDATGLENIYMRGLQMRLSIKQIRELIPLIVEFSELADHIHKPIIAYSTGMRLRLALAISTIVEPDILLLDEWLGVGDARFNMKVRERLMGLIEGSRGLVLATHNQILMESLCTHGIVMKAGGITYFGKISDALKFFND